MLKLEFLGVGSGLSLGLGNNSAMIYEDDPKNGFVLIDCGDQTRITLQERGLIDYVHTVVITHLHGDHIGGLEMLGFYYNLKLKKKLTVLAPSRKIYKDLKTYCEVTMLDVHDDNGLPEQLFFEDYFEGMYIGGCFSFEDIKEVDIKELKDLPQVPNYMVDDLWLTFKPATHIVGKECYGVVFGDKRNGKQHYYTSDQKSLVYLFKDQYENVWHDCSLVDYGVRGVHAYIGDIRRDLPEVSGIKNLWLMHYNRPVTEDEMTEAKTWCRGFVVPGQVFEL